MNYLFAPSVVHVCHLCYAYFTPNNRLARAGAY